MDMGYDSKSACISNKVHAQRLHNAMRRTDGKLNKIKAHIRT